MDGRDVTKYGLNGVVIFSPNGTDVIIQLKSLSPPLIPVLARLLEVGLTDGRIVGSQLEIVDGSKLGMYVMGSIEGCELEIGYCSTLRALFVRALKSVPCIPSG